MASAAVLTSCRVRSVGPAIDRSTPFAPSIEDSRSGDGDRRLRGLLRAVLAGPVTDSHQADPKPLITAFTSAKSRLINPGVVINDVMPSTP